MTEMGNAQKMDLRIFLETDHRLLLSTKEVARILGVSHETVYDWKYRAAKRGISEATFVKVRRKLYFRSDLLKFWVVNCN